MLATLWLAGCATPTIQPDTARPHDTARPSATITVQPPAEPASPAMRADAAVPPDIWQRLRDSFVMADCDQDPAILATAQRFTRDPQRFQAQLDEALPRIAYVQRIAAAHQVAGEFSLLPWVESGFRPAPEHRRDRPAGMWQIMPITARHLGLRVDKAYDGRLDIAAATDAVMAALQDYYAQFHDWRLVDYAYNAGASSVRRLADRHGLPPADPAIPHWPVHTVTREHLTRLLAIACIVRAPERFDVVLPGLIQERQLEAIRLDRPLAWTQAEARTGMPAEQIHHYNVAYAASTTHAPRDARLLLPQAEAARLRQSMDADAGTFSAALASTPAPLPTLDNGVPANATRTDEQTPDLPTPSGTQTTHTVRAGETLGLIARRHGISVDQLRRWNHLAGSRIKPGQQLRVVAP
jgi:membrane-bound lytic murein transglycosylase D